ncbi:hypothetical protein BGX28_006301 [Mortierella sp. GBA30]|nr:hypothetical protein BGX28_006301 [Mortierella sp. GBA30]
MSATNRNYCCCCIPFRFAVAIFSILALALGGASLWNILRVGVTDSAAKIAAYVATAVYLILGLSGLFSVVFKKYALAKNFSVLWWTVTILTTILACVGVVLLATREKDEAKGICRASLLRDNTYPDTPAGSTALEDDVDSCFKYVMIFAGAGTAVQVLVMLVGGWVASRYTSEVKHRKDGLIYGPVQGQVGQTQPLVAHPYTQPGDKRRRSRTKLILHLLLAIVSVAFVVQTSAQSPHHGPRQHAVAVEEKGGDHHSQQSILMPQQTKQILDTDTYHGHEPNATYPIDGPSPSWWQALSDESVAQGPSSKVDEEVQQMAEQMTVKELVGQMTQIQIGELINEDGALDMDKVKYWIEEWGVGSFLDTPANLDSVHGANYVDGAVMFPQEIGLAATFNTTLAYEAGRIAAKDTRAAGIPWVFAPILDVAVHKLWPRVYETFGEDPYLAAQMGSAIIKGLQGNYKEDRTRVAACMKHFIGYSAPRNGQDRSSAWIPDNYLMDYFVPSFQAAVKAGVATAMETYIDVNGQPVVSSYFYLTELLRNRLEFKGLLVTDWGEVDRLYTEHRTATSLKDAARQCLKQTTIDMVMVPESESFSHNTAGLVEEDTLERQRLVDSVAKILQLKKDLGLFQNPKSDPNLLSLVGSQQDIEAARQAARESITVLKNENSVLPLIKKFQQDHQKEQEQRDAHGPRKVFLTGPAADSILALSGGWSIKWQGARTDDWFQGRGESILQGLRKELGENVVSYLPSVDFDGNSIGSNEYLVAAKDADTVILCLGESPYAEILGNINEIDLPWGQLELIFKITEQAKQTNTRVILVLVEGRPRGLQDLVDRVDAVVMAYLPGPWGGFPIAEVLTGTVNPSGRLPITYPLGSGDMVTSYYRSGIDPYKPLFPFAAGLSYTTVEYRNLRLSSYQLHTKTDDENNQSTESHELEDVDSDEERVPDRDDEEDHDGDDGDQDDDGDDDDEDDDGQDEEREEDEVEGDFSAPRMKSKVDPQRRQNRQSIKRRSKAIMHLGEDLLKASPHNKALKQQPENRNPGIKVKTGQDFMTSSDGHGPSILAKITVENTGDYPVKETVFWYITQDVRSDVMPEAFMLKGFQKVSLEEGETKDVQFKITRDALVYHGRDLKKKVEKGVFTLTVNAMRPEAQSIKFDVV